MQMNQFSSILILFYDLRILYLFLQGFINLSLFFNMVQ